MKAITLKQPWAQLVIDGHKRIETRSWKTNFRGSLLIHAGKSFSFLDLELCHQDKYFQRCIPDPTKLITGALLGVVEVLDMKPVEEVRSLLTKRELTFGDYRDGRYAWILGHVHKFNKPIYGVSGAQGLWDYNKLLDQWLVKN